MANCVLSVLNKENDDDDDDDKPQKPIGLPRDTVAIRLIVKQGKWIVLSLRQSRACSTCTPHNAIIRAKCSRLGL